MSNTLSITVVLRHRFAIDGGAVIGALDILNTNLSVVASGPLRDGNGAAFPVPSAGRYVVRCTLVSGERLTEAVDVPSGESSTVILTIPSRLTSTLTRSGWLAAWRPRRSSLEFRPMATSELSENVGSLIVDRLGSHRENVVVQYAIADLAPIFTVVPSATPVRVLVDHHSENPQMELASSLARALSGFAHSGDVASARILLATAIFEAPGNEALDLAVGYQLLRTGDERLDTWSRNLVERWPKSFDAHVIRGWAKLYTDDEWETAADSFYQAARCGLPAYSRGLRLLDDALRLAASAEVNPALAAARQRYLPYLRVVFDTVLTTFWGSDPTEPSFRPVPGPAPAYARSTRFVSGLIKFSDPTVESSDDAIAASADGRGSVVVPRRALLIGAAHRRLDGVKNDLMSIEDLLRAQGFEITLCLDDATRAGILDSYEQLIANIVSNDAVLVYYSGRGGSVLPPSDPTQTPAAADMRFIAPLDYDDSTEGDFRGITMIELSGLLARLTAKSINVTTIFDCSYVGHMSRDISLEAKALERSVPYDVVRAHLASLGDIGLADIADAAQAVQIIACAPDQAAYEYEGKAGGPIGLLTESLTMALQEASIENVSWATVMDRVRRRVLALTSTQRPEIEGPVRRIPFSTVEQGILTTLPVTSIGTGRVALACAPLLDVRRNDEFMIMPAVADRPDPAARIGDLRIDTITHFTAEGHIAFAEPWAEIPAGARAYRTKIGAPTLPVRLDGIGRESAMAAAITREPLVHLVDDRSSWLAGVSRNDASDLTIYDRTGLLHGPYRSDDHGVRQVMSDLRMLAQAMALRTMSGGSEAPLNASVDIEWGRVIDGTKQPLAASGSVVRAGDRVYLTVRNEDSGPIYVTLVDIGVSGRVSVLTAASATGYRVMPGMEYTLGVDNVEQKLTGVPLNWPVGMDPTQARPETVLILITSASQNLTTIGHIGSHSVSRSSTSRLESLIDQLSAGGTRDIEDRSAPDVWYDIHTIDFELAAIPEEQPFRLDERPAPPTLYRASKGNPPMNVAVRLDELVIDPRSISGTDIRLDALVLTGTGNDAQPVYSASTAQFGLVRGAKLPVDRWLLYHGLAFDYLDIAIWVSYGVDSDVPLHDHLAADIDGSEVQTALTKLRGTVLPAAQAAGTAVAAGAGAVIVNRAYQLLRNITGNTTGLYRSSTLASQRFGIGRHSVSSTDDWDFSLVYTVTDISRA